MSDQTTSDYVRWLRRKAGYRRDTALKATTSKWAMIYEEEADHFDGVADRIRELEAENERLRENQKRLLGLASLVATDCTNRSIRDLANDLLDALEADDE
jgi:hypothetical protein